MLAMHDVIVTWIDRFWTLAERQNRLRTHDRSGRKLVVVAQAKQVADFVHRRFKPTDFCTVIGLTKTVVPVFAAIHDRKTTASEPQVSTRTGNDERIKGTQVASHDREPKRIRFDEIHSQIVGVKVEHFTSALLLCVRDQVLK